MPMIEAKVTMELPAEKRYVLKAEFGKAISIMGKPESYLMINLVDKQDLYFGGKKLDKGAYVEVKVLGSIDGSASDKMTAKLCEILEKELGIPGNAVYVSYWGTANWGWNGSNFQKNKISLVHRSPVGLQRQTEYTLWVVIGKTYYWRVIRDENGKIIDIKDDEDYDNLNVIDENGKSIETCSLLGTAVLSSK